MNPIAFNAMTMTGYQMIAACDTLRTLFDLLNREATAEDIKGYLELVREQLTKR